MYDFCFLLFCHSHGALIQFLCRGDGVLPGNVVGIGILFLIARPQLPHFLAAGQRLRTFRNAAAQQKIAFSFSDCPFKRFFQDRKTDIVSSRVP